MQSLKTSKSFKTVVEPPPASEHNHEIRIDQNGLAGRITLSFVAEKTNKIKVIQNFALNHIHFNNFSKKNLPKKVIQLFVICFHGLFGLGPVPMA